MHYPSTHNLPSILSFFPNTRGVGYSFFESHKQHTTSGMITTRKRFTNERYLMRIKKCIEDYQPSIIILEEYRINKGSVKKERIRNLIKEIAKYAKEQNITFCFYTRHHLRDVFSAYNVMKKYDIAKLVCAWIPDLKKYMYQPRSGQRMEPYSSAVFEAVSLVLTHVYLRE